MAQYFYTEIAYTRSSYANTVSAYSSSDEVQTWLRNQFETLARQNKQLKLAVEQIGVLGRFRPIGLNVQDSNPRDFTQFLLRSLLAVGWEPFSVQEGYVQDQGKEVVTYYLRRQE